MGVLNPHPKPLNPLYLSLPYGISFGHWERDFSRFPTKTDSADIHREE
jgi:hypothetical protein